MDYILGIDTSCYTTSISIVDTKGSVVFDKRKMLKVKHGQRGLQQSQAYYQHNDNLVQLMSDIKPIMKNIKSIGVSTKPRPICDSFMPVFKAGHNAAKILSFALDIPLVQTSHQEGHIMAGLYSAKGPESQSFLCVHVSGGTSDVLEVTRCVGHGFTVNTLGGTQDLNAGQFIDRVGVALGMDFPCGKEMEQLARKGKTGSILPSSVKGRHMSFSGPETMAQRLIKQGVPKEDIALSVFLCIARSLLKVLNNCYQEKTKFDNILFVGGVSSNTYIREYLKAKLNNKFRLYFAQPYFSVDNAVGVALLGKT
jgi:N6-L-threonylcarbamoyladenine synthase